MKRRTIDEDDHHTVLGTRKVKEEKKEERGDGGEKKMEREVRDRWHLLPSEIRSRFIRDAPELGRII